MSYPKALFPHTSSINSQSSETRTPHIVKNIVKDSATLSFPHTKPLLPRSTRPLRPLRRCFSSRYLARSLVALFLGVIYPAIISDSNWIINSLPAAILSASEILTGSAILTTPILTGSAILTAPILSGSAILTGPVNLIAPLLITPVLITPLLAEAVKPEVTGVSYNVDSGYLSITGRELPKGSNDEDIELKWLSLIGKGGAKVDLGPGTVNVFLRENVYY
jgi:predicted membrane metal-binding protein